MATATPSAAPRLVGRARELQALFALVDGLRERGGTLVVRGEAGIGRTSLLNAAIRRAADRGVRVLDAPGVHAEADMPFSGLHQLLLPLLDRLGQLPLPQRDALASALGLDVTSAPDRFLIGLAVLNLLSQEAEKRPLLCVLDDAQLLDRASAQVLTFAARRLTAEAVAIVFAELEPSKAFRGLPELVVEGLRDVDARALLRSAVLGPLDARVGERILAEARGNPLGLLEPLGGISPGELAGGFGFPEVTSGIRPLSGRLEERFLPRLENLPDDTRLLLLVAAADPVGDPALLWGAAGRLGIAPDAIAPARAAGLLAVDTGVRFHNPLVRSAVYRAAASAERRQVHRALGEVTEPGAAPERRAWHRALGTQGPDEDVAVELERSAGRAQARGGRAAAAAFLERSAGLTPDPALRSRRALAAARAKYEAASPAAASELLATAEVGPLTELERARVERLRVQVAFAQTRRTDGSALVLDAARRLEALDAELARETYLEALAAAIFAGRTDDLCGVTHAAQAARAAPPVARPPRPTDLLLDALAVGLTEPYAAALPWLRRALDALAATDGRGDDIRWLWFAGPVTPEPLGPEAWDDEACHQLATRTARIARDAGALSVLPVALTYRACVHVHAGELAAASALIEEADAISEATGNAPLRYASLAVVAWRGHETAAMREIDIGIHDATARGEGRAIGFARYVTAVLYNGLGRYEEALTAARRACAHDDLGVTGWALTELVEAAVRGHNRELAADALRRLAERTTASGTNWGLGIEARSRALLSEGEAAERLYKEAIERLARTRIRVELARAQLQYGEWLRREARRVDAREQLRRAHDAFASMGADGFAERARRELLATGEKVRSRRNETRDDLTPQEEQIACLARNGLTNPQIGATLFLSPRTVEWHLRKVFSKLDINSRRGLQGALPSRAQDVAHA